VGVGLGVIVCGGEGLYACVCAFVRVFVHAYMH